MDKLVILSYPQLWIRLGIDSRQILVELQGCNLTQSELCGQPGCLSTSYPLYFGRVSTENKKLSTGYPQAVESPSTGIVHLEGKGEV